MKHANLEKHNIELKYGLLKEQIIASKTDELALAALDQLVQGDIAQGTLAYEILCHFGFLSSHHLNQTYKRDKIGTGRQQLSETSVTLKTCCPQT